LENPVQKSERDRGELKKERERRERKLLVVRERLMREEELKMLWQEETLR